MQYHPTRLSQLSTEGVRNFFPIEQLEEDIFIYIPLDDVEDVRDPSRLRAGLRRPMSASDEVVLAPFG